VTELKDFSENYATLGQNGDIKMFAGGDAFWSLPPSDFEKIGESWLVTEYYFDKDWESWEMHPEAEEIVYLLSGSVDLVLEKDGNRRTVELRGKGVVIVQRGTWHTAKVIEPSNMLVITLGKGTETRPVD
jgi:mannose-6-phosphate isomerase-like protein (cupin superfamily)